MGEEKTACWKYIYIEFIINPTIIAFWNFGLKIFALKSSK